MMHGMRTQQRCAAYAQCACSGDKAELRADAPEYKPSPAAGKPKSEPVTKRPASDTALRGPIEGAEKRSVVSAAKDDKPSGGSAKPPVHPEAAPKSTGKRTRDADQSSGATRTNAEAEPSKATGDEQEPKKRKVQSS